jgi:LPS export ABC transporter protein LptC
LTPLALLLALALVVLLYYADRDDAPSNIEGDEPALSPAGDIDAIITEAEYLQYHPNGRLAARILSQRAIHYTDSEHVIFTSPKMTLYPEETPGQTQVTADSGTWYPERHLLNLSGQIVMRQQHQPDEPETILRTEHLEYRQTENFISTDQVVTITRGQAQLQAIGLEADLTQKRMTLLSDVRGRYEPMP